MREAVAVLEQVQGRAPLLDLEDILFRLRQQLDDPEQDLDRIIRFEITGIRRGREHLAMLYRCVRDRQCLYLDYQAFYHDTPQRGLFTPLLLKRYNRRWFLLGWDHTDQRIETRPLDRILGFELAPNRPQDPPARFYESWLANVVGVTRLSDAPLEEVVVRVGRALAPYSGRAARPRRRYPPVFSATGIPQLRAGESVAGLRRRGGSGGAGALAYQTARAAPTGGG